MNLLCEVLVMKHLSSSFNDEKSRNIGRLISELSHKQKCPNPRHVQSSWDFYRSQNDQREGHSASWPGRSLETRIHTAASWQLVGLHLQGLDRQNLVCRGWFSLLRDGESWFLSWFPDVNCTPSKLFNKWHRGSTHRRCVKYIDLITLWKLIRHRIMICCIITHMPRFRKALKKVLKFSLSFQIKLQDQVWLWNDRNESSRSFNIVCFVWCPLFFTKWTGCKNSFRIWVMWYHTGLATGLGHNWKV